VFSPTKGTAVHEYAFVGVLRVKIGSTACQDHHRVTSPHTASCHSIFKNFFLKVGGKILCTEKEIFKKLSGNWLYGEK